MTRLELRKCLIEKEFQQEDAKSLVDSFFLEIARALGQGHCVKLSGFGNFKLSDKRARVGRDFETGNAVVVSARRVVTFHAGQKLRADIEKTQRDKRQASEPEGVES